MMLSRSLSEFWPKMTSMGGLCGSFNSRFEVYHSHLHLRRNVSMKQPVPDDLPVVDMENPYKVLPKRCTLCGIKVDYKNAQLLSQFVSSFTGLLLPQRGTSLCDRKYGEVSRAIRQSRIAGFLPSALKETVFLDDPVLSKNRFRK